MNGADDTPDPKASASGPERTFGQLLAEARGKDSQRGTAKRFRLSHTAWGRLEKDDIWVVGADKLAEIAETMGVPLPKEHHERRSQRRGAKVMAFCANPLCLDAFVSVTPDNDVHVEPRSFRISQKRLDDYEAFCDSCGKPLETECRDCKTPFKQGAHCSRCSLSFVRPNAADRAYLVEQHEQYPQDPRTRNARTVIEAND